MVSGSSLIAVLPLAFYIFTAIMGQTLTQILKLLQPNLFSQSKKSRNLSELLNVLSSIKNWQDSNTVMYNS